MKNIFLKYHYLFLLLVLLSTTLHPFLEVEGSSNSDEDKKELEGLIEIIKKENVTTVIQTWFAAISVITVIILSIFSITYPQKKNRQELLKNSMIAIKKELEDTLEGLKNDKKTFIEFKGEQYYFVREYFDTSSYDSVINSGYFIHMKPNLQIEITQAYSRIKKNNQLLDEIVNLKNMFYIYTNIDKDFNNLKIAENRIYAAISNLQNETETSISIILNMFNKTQ